MFDRISGLPGHPLIVHGAVVLVPLLCLLAIVYALVPRFRPQSWWAAGGLAIVAPLVAWAATSSGGSLAEERYQDNLPARVHDHQQLGDMTYRATVILGLLTLVLVVLTSARFSAARRTPTWLNWVLSALVVIAAAVDIYYVIRTGDSGARNTWGSE